VTAWTEDRARDAVFRFDHLSPENRRNLLDVLDQRFPAEKVGDQLLRRKKALDNLALNKNKLSHGTQLYPECLAADALAASAKNLAGYAIVLTAGGEGERLYHSLVARGMDHQRLVNFTKVTFPLPDFYSDFGSLHVNLTLIAAISREYGIEIPVIVTTGPDESITAQIIPSIISDYNAFGLKSLKIIRQDERIHFTQEEKIAWTLINGHPRVITNPDETGGPLMKLKQRLPAETDTAIEWLLHQGCDKVIVLQATALYAPELIPAIAAAGKKFDGLGVGIVRELFTPDDPYGTFVLAQQNNRKRLLIAEKEVRNSATMSLKDPTGSRYLPFNTGFYVFDIRLIQNNDLPDYATPPKEIVPDLPKSPKIGFAATDMISFAQNPAVLSVSPDSYGVIKNADDLSQLSLLGKKLGLDKICKTIHGD